MSVENKQVAIIGAGPHGLTAAKAMLEQNLVPTLFEKNSGIGGVWNKNSGNVWPNMKANVTKYYIGFSDFLWDQSADLYPSESDLRNYLERYAEHFNIVKHIKLNSTVVSAKQLEDKRWSIKWRCAEDNTEHEQIYEFLVVATGLFTNPFIPQVDNQEAFKGFRIHSKDYPKVKSTLNGKNIVVVGNCNSGADISADLTLDGAHVVNVFRNPHWVCHRLLNLDPEHPNAQISLDWLLFSRKMSCMVSHLQTRSERNAFKNTIMSQILRDQNENKDLYIDPSTSDRILLSISDNYMRLVKEGLIKTKKGFIQKFTENGVYFDDGTYLDIDGVVWCTGYRLLFNFFDESILNSLEYDYESHVQPIITYKSTFPRNIENLAFVGIVRDPAYSLCEIQARWASLVFSGKQKLPSKEKINEDLIQQREARTIRPPGNFVVEDLILYIDEVAKEINALPDFEAIKKADENLYNSFMLDGPACSVHFRYNENKDLVLKVLDEIKQVTANLAQS